MNARRLLGTVPLLAFLLLRNSTASPAINFIPAISENVRDFGATGDGKTKDTLAFQLAIDRCHILGGGEVVVPSGDYLIGAIALKSHTTLRLAKGATLLGTPDFEDYPMTQVRWEGRWIAGHVGLIYASDADHIGIVGPGKIIGNGAVSGRPTSQSPERRPALIETINCSDVRLEDFSTQYQSMSSLHFTYGENVSVKNVTVRSTGASGMGIEIDSCKHVLIDGCDLATSDDCIAIKSGRGMEALTLLRTTEDVHITHCTLADSVFACVAVGSETSGGIRNVRVEHCKVTHAQSYAIYIKSRVGRGAFIEDISADDMDVAGTVQGFLRVNLFTSGARDPDSIPGEEGIPAIRNLRFSNIRVVDCPALVDALGIYPSKPLQGFSLTNVTGTAAKGISLANVRQADLRDIKITGLAGPLINIVNVSGSGLEGAVPPTTLPAVPAAIAPPTEPYLLH